MSYEAIPMSAFSKTAQAIIKAHPMPKPTSDMYFYQHHQPNYTRGIEPHLTTLGELSDSLETEEANQWSITAKRVSTFLCASQVGFAYTHMMYLDIEIGYLSLLWEELGDDAPFYITSGRHRLVGVLTMYQASGIASSLVRSQLVRVVPKVYDTVEDVARAIFMANGSRGMAKGEQDNVLTQLKGVDTSDPDALVLAVEAGELRPSVSAGLWFVAMGDRYPTAMTRQTLNLIGQGFISKLLRNSLVHKRAMPDVFGELLEVAWELLPSMPIVGDNVARQARSIADSLAKEVNIKTLAEVRKPGYIKRGRPRKVVIV